MFVLQCSRAEPKVPVLPADSGCIGLMKTRRHTRMSVTGFVPVLVVLLAVCALVLPVTGYTTTDSLTSAGRVYVSNVTIDPVILFTGDKATVTFAVTNGNANSGSSNTSASDTSLQGIMVNHATFGNDEIQLTSGTYDTSSNIGPLQTRTYVFNVVTGEPDGTYYPTFSLDFRDAGSLYYRTPVKVDNSPLLVSVTDQPDTFTEGKKDTITVQIANPRGSAVKNVVLNVTGSGATITPSEQYIGWLAANSAKSVNLSVTPNTETVLGLTVEYDNGDNHHEVSASLPVTFGTDKKQAAPTVSNIEVKLEGDVYHVTGDVTNAGLTTANGVTVTALSPAVPEDPYRSYVIGALKPDDFGSFEVTFTAPNATARVPLQVSYKDSDGNVLTSQQDVSILGVLPDTAAQQGSPVLPIIVVLVILAAGGYYYYAKKIKKQ